MEISSKEFFELINKNPSASLGEGLWLVIKDEQLLALLETPDGYYKYEILTIEDLLEIIDEYR